MQTEHKIDLFIEDPIEQLNAKFNKLEKGYDNVRRGQFARISALGTTVLQYHMQLQQEIDFLREKISQIEKMLGKNVLDSHSNIN